MPSEEQATDAAEAEVPEWMPEDDGELVSPGVLAERVGVSVPAALKMMRAGDMPGVAQDVRTRRWLLPRGELPPAPVCLTSRPATAIRTDAKGWVPGSHAVAHHSVPTKRLSERATVASAEETALHKL
jgi:hypothetical protein